MNAICLPKQRIPAEPSSIQTDHAMGDDAHGAGDLHEGMFGERDGQGAAEPQRKIPDSKFKYHKEFRA